MLCLVRVVILWSLLCELVSSQAADNGGEPWWQRSADPFDLGPDVQRSSPERRQVAQSGTPLTLPGGVVVPAGIFDIPPNVTSDGGPDVQGPSPEPQQVAQSGTSLTLPGGVVVPAGIFEIPPSGTGDGEDTYDATLNCRCVQFFQCDANNAIITTGQGQIDARFQNQEDVWNVRQCPDTAMRCCTLPPGVTAPPRKQTPGVTLPPGVTAPPRKQPPGVTAPPGKQPPTSPTRAPKCGVRRPSGIDSLLRIKDGEETEFGEFPWMLALLKVQAVEGGAALNMFECGASLIHPQVALTAAHCTRRARKRDPTVQFKVRAGEWDTKTTDELLPHQDRDVTQVIEHEGHNSGSLFNDVALLVLSSPLEMEDNVDTICLPEVGDTYDGSDCIATGWGRDAFDFESAFQRVLRKVTVQMTPAQRCQEELRKTRVGVRFKLNRSFVCASGRSGQDTCRGDGGGPLVCPSTQNPDLYAQVGVVSWGVGCGDVTPAVYANVAHQRAWIDGKLAGLGFSGTTAARA